MLSSTTPRTGFTHLTAILAALGVIVALVVATAATITTYAQPANAQDHDSHLVALNNMFRDDEITTMDAVLEDTGKPIYVIITDNFAPSSATQWCVDEAHTRFPDDAAVFAIATEERAYATCFGPDGSQWRTAVEDAASQGVRQLSSNPLPSHEVVAAVEVFANTVSNAPASGNSSSGGSSTVERHGLSSTARASLLSSIFDAVGSLVTFLAVPAIIAFAWFMVIRRGRNAIGKRAEQVNQKTVADATRMLMATDESLRQARQDIEFARAQFGDSAVAGVEDTLNGCAEQLAQAWQIYRDSCEGGAPTLGSVAATQRIVSICEQVTATISTLARDFDNRRQRESSVEADLATITSEISEVRGHVARARSELQSLTARWGAQALASIATAPDEAENLLAAAEQAVAQGQAALATSKDDAVYHYGVARRSLTQAKSALDDVMRAANDLEQSHDRLIEAVASLTADLRDVEQLAPDSPAFSPLVTDAQRAIEQATQARRGIGDPLGALRTVRDAEAALDAALASLRSQRDNEQRTSTRVANSREEADQAIERAQAMLRAVSTWQESATARSQLAHAEQLRAQAERVADPEARATMYGQAVNYANSAYEMLAAQRQRGSTQSDSLIDLGSLILGGLLFGQHGSRGDYGRYGSFGGSSRGSSGWSGGSFGSSGSFGSGGWSSGSSGKF